MKNIYKSKTVWLGVITFVAGGFMALESSYPAIGGVVMAKAVLDVVLRYITTEPIK